MQVWSNSRTTIRKGKSKKLGKNLLHGHSVHHQLQIQSPSLEPKASQWKTEFIWQNYGTV